MWQKVVEIIGHHVEPFSTTAEAAEQVVIDLGIYWNSDGGASNETLLWDGSNGEFPPNLTDQIIDQFFFS